jgi:hypothetical protein
VTPRLDATYQSKVYFAGKLNLVSFFGREQGNPGAPREWGVTFKHNFQ